MRKTKFRGKTIMSEQELKDKHFLQESRWFKGNLAWHGNVPWIVGDLVEVDDEYVINDFWVRVYPESVGQLTGLKDVNGRDIYEGDICEYEDGEHSFIAIVEPDYVNWYLKGISPKENFNINGFHDCGKSWLKIIGNVFENPELLEVKHD